MKLRRIDPELWGFLWFILIVCIVVVCAMLWLARETCFAQWQSSGLPVRWGPLAGCQVQRLNGTWIPAQSLREVKP